MSGRKRIQVDESEWYRVQRKAQQLKDVQRNLPRLIDEVRAQTRADVDRAFTTVRERQQRHEEAVRGLSDRTRQLEADTTRRLREQAAQLHRTLHETAGRIQEETRRRLAEQQAETRKAIAAERAERRAGMARLSREIDAMKEDRARAGESVRTWLADARTMAGLIAATLPHERYAPGELARLTGRLSTAEQNAAEGRFDAALAVAQETYHSLSELRVDTEQRELERCSAQQEAVEALVRVEALVEGNEQRPVIGPDGEALAGYALDVVYWSEGELEALRREAAAALARARDDEAGTAELRDLRDQEAPRLEADLGSTVERAGMRHLASQIRVNLADAVAHSLGEYAYYDLVDGEYENADPRGRYYAKLRNEANGNEIVVDIAQADRDSERCVVRVMSYDHDTTAEAELHDRAEAVQQALAADGLRDGLRPSAPVSEPGTPDPGLLDVARHHKPFPAAPATPRPRPREQPQPGTVAE
ncbi:coiled-coil domain-containing protein [Streptomyces hiroshimensis]|uniref:Large Ala/Glu-rich protein n=1 Tax=Streptomyces hiroshimensis TaxID=66424 RepID=A0ABQ2Y7T3_9ACTN|nr:hypothetical protein [Streptomyces hiroshimensis]GGX73299.1 hypothetical protein GCM10010324_18170 [Streptomyces hiroshimensis]